MLLDEFRSGKIGRITLELPEDCASGEKENAAAETDGLPENP